MLNALLILIRELWCDRFLLLFNCYNSDTILLIRSLSGTLLDIGLETTREILGCGQPWPNSIFELLLGALRCWIGTCLDSYDIVGRFASCREILTPARASNCVSRFWTSLWLQLLLCLGRRQQLTTHPFEARRSLSLSRRSQRRRICSFTFWNNWAKCVHDLLLHVHKVTVLKTCQLD